MPEGLAAIAHHLPWAVGLPLFAALFNATLGARMARSVVAGVACGALAFDFVWALEAFAALRAAPAGTIVSSAPWPWLTARALDVPLRLMADALSVTMWLIVSGIGLLIHIYSARYQADEPGYARYFAWLNLFVAAMLLLVFADALPVAFIGWEGVGLASWALIGFEFGLVPKVRAGKKAFVVNRIGDAGLLLAMFILLGGLHTLNYVDMRAALAGGTMDSTTLGAAAFLLALAASGKSAQLPLYLWLPDAMAGPTPVSALIHAATMVTAGIYLLARMSFVLATSHAAMAAVALVGAATALFAACAALGQNDLKKCLAYSTVSQLGYMFMAVGLGAAPLALFHVTTHAAFKACLFLAAGAVIHAAHGEQDMRRLGGLGRLLPRIAWPAGVATLAIAGVPPLSGFVSKDAILAHAFAASQAPQGPLGGVPGICYATGLLTALLTALYMGRWYLWIFASGPCRLPAQQQRHLHDAPLSMAVPLWALAGLAVGLSALGWPHALGGSDRFGAWLAGDKAGSPLGGSMVLEAPALPLGLEWGLLFASAVVAAIGLGLAWAQSQAPAAEAPPRHALGAAARQAFGVDAALESLVVVPFEVVARDVLRHFERRLTSSAMLVLGHAVRLSAWLVALFHTGNVQRYMALFALAAALLLWGWLLPLGGHALYAALEGLA